MNDINANTIGQFFQDIISQFSDMNPTNMDTLENEVLNAIYKLGSLMMEWKLSNWNAAVKKDNCQQCNTKLQNRKRSRQIATMVSDVSFARYMSYCPNCKKTEYTLDETLGLRSRQRMSSQLEELSSLCGASWSYEQSESVLKKILHRYCVSHNTIHELTNAVGEEVSKETDGSKIKELESDKIAQSDYFENIQLADKQLADKQLADKQLADKPQVRIYADMDGVMINSRDNANRMEGKVAMVWSERELVNANTYAITDKRYMGSFVDMEIMNWDMEIMNWDIVLELYKRSRGNLDGIECLVRGDGAPWIRGFREEHMPKSRYILDYYHLCKKVKDRVSLVYEDKKNREISRREIMKYLDSGNVDGALSYIQELRKRFRKDSKIYSLDRLSGYIERNREGIWYSEAKSKGISIGSGTADKAGDILICRRMKLRGMRWSRKGADSVLTEILDIHINHCYDWFSSHFSKSAVLLKPCYDLIRYSNIYKNCRIFCFFNFADFTSF